MEETMVNNLSVQAALTERCNLKCIQCGLWQNEHKKLELTTEQWFSIFLKIKKWIGHSYQLNIGGGEPFMRKDIIEIIKFCVENEIKPCLVTNATLLDQSKIEVLSEIETLTLNISLDGFIPRTHDSLRGDGIYQNIINVLKSFKSNNRKCKIVIATVIMQSNFKEAASILNKLVMEDKLADAQIIQAIWISDPSGKYEKEWYKKNILWPNADEKEDLISRIDELIEFKKRGLALLNPIEHLQFFKLYFTQLEKCVSVLSCDIGDRNFIIDPSGKVLLCWNMKSIGDILEESPDEIWHSPLAIERRKQIEICKMPCRILNCNYNLEK